MTRKIVQINNIELNSRSNERNEDSILVGPMEINAFREISDFQVDNTAKISDLRNNFNSVLDQLQLFYNTNKP